jgi:two-component system cell cycle sensor histidine kinase/response regulator CckA
VNDEGIVWRIGRTSPERCGYRAILATNGREAVEEFKSKPDDIYLVILDMTMPGMDGAEVLEELLVIRKDIRVIVSSGYNEVEVICRFTSQGVAGFIQKAYTASALTGKVQSILDRKNG